MTKQKLWELIEAYRTSGGREEHHARKERLDAVLDELLERRPLTDEEIEKVWRRVQANDFHDCVQPFARAIEAHHGIKENT